MPSRLEPEVRKLKVQRDPLLGIGELCEMDTAAGPSRTVNSALTGARIEPTPVPRP